MSKIAELTFDFGVKSNFQIIGDEVRFLAVATINGKPCGAIAESFHVVDLAKYSDEDKQELLIDLRSHFAQGMRESIEEAK